MLGTEEHGDEGTRYSRSWRGFKGALEGGGGRESYLEGFWCAFCAVGCGSPEEAPAGGSVTLQGAD